MDRTALSLLLRSFERHLRAENRSEHTIATYLDSLCQAEAFLAGRGRTLMDARREDLEAFLRELLQRRAPETVATRYRRLRVLYRWLEEEDDSRVLSGRAERPQARLASRGRRTCLFGPLPAPRAGLRGPPYPPTPA